MFKVSRLTDTSLSVIVIDATVLADLLIGEEDLMEAAIRLAEEDSEWISPSLWRFELGNVLWKEVRFRNGDRDRLEGTLLGAEDLVVETVADLDVRATWRIACERRLTFYDASYVWLARSRNLVLRTRDAEVLRECPDVAKPMPS